MRRILIVDDEPSVLQALMRTLRREFPEAQVAIEAFEDPEAALLRAGEVDFDLAISDYRMPGLNGADVLQMVKGLQPDTVRVVLSASTDRRDILASVNRAEVFRFLEKPWDAGELIATVLTAFERRDRQTASQRKRLAPSAPAQAKHATAVEMRNKQDSGQG